MYTPGLKNWLLLALSGAVLPVLISLLFSV
jgi:hypothetical protein